MLRDHLINLRRKVLWSPLHLFMPAVLTALVVATVALLGAGSHSAFALDPEIALVPDSGAPGDSVEVFGSGFPSFSTVPIGFSQDDGEQLVGIAETDGDGNFTTTVTVPQDATPGDALFFADSSFGGAEADFFVTESEPIGDTPGPPADKVPVCEVVVILDEVKNRLFTTDEKFQITTILRATGRASTIRDPKKPLIIDAPQGEETNVAEIISRKKIVKDGFPIKEFHVIASVAVVRPGQKPSFATIGGFVGFNVKEINCPDSRLVKFTEEEGASVEVKDKFGAKLGFFDLVYRVKVSEVQAQ
jgi:hypothetical protein